VTGDLVWFGGGEAAGGTGWSDKFGQFEKGPKAVNKGLVVKLCAIISNSIDNRNKVQICQDPFFPGVRLLLLLFLSFLSAPSFSSLREQSGIEWRTPIL
jgi:hypothetical protein